MRETKPTLRRPVLQRAHLRRAEQIGASAVPLLDSDGQPIRDAEGRVIYTDD